MNDISIEKTNKKFIKTLSKTKEGIVFMGCGGSKEQWVTDVTTDLVSEGILPEGTKPFDIWESPVYCFKVKDRDDMLFIWKQDAKFDMGKLAIWRIKLGFAMWLSDYVEYKA